MKILAIETSCDDSGIAVLEDEPQNNQPKILADFVSSQIKIHAPWGGVVPMLAKREHQRNLIPLLVKTLKKAGLLKIKKRQSSDPNGKNNAAKNSRLKILREILAREPELLKKLLPFLKKYRRPDIDYLAVTIGPGLEPALWVGVNFARALAYYWHLPVIPVNHLEGHLAAVNFRPETKLNFATTANSPSICLIVSGGHTQLILVNKTADNTPVHKIIGETRDDAAGESFDKVAKMLSLGYPGGPVIADAASSAADSLKIKKLPRPMINSDNLDFSFSGLKTAVLYQLQKMTPTQIKKNTTAIAAEFQQAVVDVLVKKTVAAAKKHNIQSIELTGGVAANQKLRQTMRAAAEKNNLAFATPPASYCADNGAMIALAAWQKIKSGNDTSDWRELKAKANLKISQ